MNNQDQTITLKAAVPEGETITFSFMDPIGLPCEGLVVRYQGQLHAYRNLCRHQPLPLDYGDGEFLDADGRYLLCRNHAALFEPGSGLCVSGPCAGASLFSYPVTESGDTITITIPHEEIDLE